MSDGKKKGWPELGIITKNKVKKRDASGQPLKDDNGNFIYLTDSSGKAVTSLSFKLADDITILRDGEPVALNSFRSGNMVSPVDEVKKLIKLGVIKEEEVESRTQKAKDIHSWLRYKIQLPPPRD